MGQSIIVKFWEDDRVIDLEQLGEDDPEAEIVSAVRDLLLAGKDEEALARLGTLTSQIWVPQSSFIADDAADDSEYAIGKVTVTALSATDEGISISHEAEFRLPLKQRVSERRLRKWAEENNWPTYADLLFAGEGMSTTGPADASYEVVDDEEIDVEEAGVRDGSNDASGSEGKAVPGPAAPLVFELLISEGGSEALRLRLDYDTIETIVSRAPDTESSADLLRLAARHPAWEVRQAVACKDTLPEDVVAALANDASIDVLRSIVRSDAFQSFASDTLVRRLVAADPQVAETVADLIERFPGVNRAAIAEELARHPDPRVVKAVAGNSSMPRKILRALREHPEPSVADAARSTLR